MKKYYLPFILLIFIFTVKIGQAQVSKAFIHVADTATTSSNVSYIDNSATNNTTTIFPLFTHHWNPGGGVGIYADVTMGMWYSNSKSKWSIFNEDVSPFIDNSSYNVLVPSTDMKSWKHIATAASITQNYTEIDHPIINGDPNAVVLFSNIWDSIYNDQPCGLFYRTSTQKWAIFYEVGTGVPHRENVGYNFVIADTNSANYSTMLHKTDPTNTSANITILDHPDLNANPNAIVFITQVWNPGGTGGVYNNHNIGVYYTGATWRIYNEDIETMPMGCGFNVLIFKNSGIGIQDNLLAKEDVKIFPNPVLAGTKLTLSLSDAISGKVKVKIYNLEGKTVLETEFVKTSGESQNAISIKDVAQGMYVLELENNGKKGMQKLIIETK